MQPTLTDVHVNAPLTNVSVAYMQQDENFIATKVFPVVPVDHRSDLFYTFAKNDWLRDEAQPRADASESAGSGYGVSTDSYSCDVFALHKDVGDQAKANADPGIDLDRGAAQFVAKKLLLRQEIQWVTDVFKTGVWGTDVTPTTLWNDDSSDPINDVDAGKEQILSVTGYEPNTLVLGYQVYRQLKRQPDIVDRLKYTQGITGRTVTPQLLAAMFDVERVLVAKAIKATNKEGEAAAYSFVFGKHAWLGYVAPNPSPMEPSAGYTFSWRGVSDGMGADVGTVRIPMPLKRATRIESQTAFDNKVVASDLGYFFNGAVA
jgi:hypothetical protein